MKRSRADIELAVFQPALGERADSLGLHHVYDGLAAPMPDHVAPDQTATTPRPLSEIVRQADRHLAEKSVLPTGFERFKNQRVFLSPRTGSGKPASISSATRCSNTFGSTRMGSRCRTG